MRRRANIFFQVNTIFSSVRRHLLSSLDEVTWLQPVMREEAKRKIQMLRGDFLGSDLYFNKTLMDSRYRDVSETIKLENFHFTGLEFYPHYVPYDIILKMTNDSIFNM